MNAALRRHWPEYLMEALGLGLFMVSAALFATLLQYPGSPVRQAIESPLMRRMLMGLAMGLTALGNVYSPWGRRSGAHLNPALTLTFLRLGKVRPWDALFYVLAQFGGALAGLALAAAAIGAPLGSPPVLFIATLPGPAGLEAAFAAEGAIAFVLMLTVLWASSHPRLARFTGCFAAALVALFITVEDPLSGMSMNPARSFAPALRGSLWTALWIYFTAPPLGMLLAAQVYTRLGKARPVICAKLHHDHSVRCIFRCGYAAKAASGLSCNAGEDAESKRCVVSSAKGTSERSVTHA